MQPRRALALLLSLLPACGLTVGRKPQGEFRLQATPPGKGPEFGNALFQSVGATLVPGNRVELVDNGEAFDAMVEEIGRAKRSVHIVTFIWTKGRVSDRIIAALAARKGEGLRCRILVDAVGSMSFGDELQKPLEEAGCEVHRFRPIPGQDDKARNHRKIFVADGKVGITGGFGIDDKWLGKGLSDDPPEWRDSNLRVFGPVVRYMQQAIAENWQEATGGFLDPEDFPQLAPQGQSAAAFVTSTDHGVVTKGDRLTQLFIAAARHRMWISNAYFVPSAPVMELLRRKAEDGVDVRVLAAGDKTDTKPYLPMQRARMESLAGVGVRAYEYQPAMMHGKTMLADDSLVSVGSCNLDALSLNKLDEGALVVDDPAVARELARRFEQDAKYSKLVVSPKLPSAAAASR